MWRHRDEAQSDSIVGDALGDRRRRTGTGRGIAEPTSTPAAGKTFDVDAVHANLSGATQTLHPTRCQGARSTRPRMAALRSSPHCRSNVG